jgi:hypothetical protein
MKVGNLFVTPKGLRALAKAIETVGGKSASLGVTLWKKLIRNYKRH